MIDIEKKRLRQEEKNRTRKRMNRTIDYDNYEYIPAKKQTDYYDNDVNQRVAIYVRVSTDSVKQTTSYELQKKYYEDFVKHHPKWTLVGIYADEGISGTSLRHRDQFNKMIADCKAGKIDMIVCKNVSRFARNVTDCIGIVRDLSNLKSPVGVFFESERIFSLKDESQLTLSFLATMAEEESHTRSRSMETSLRMRLDNGIPLTPKLLGYTHDSNGELKINTEEAPTVKLVFFMYLYGFTTQQIADALIKLGRKSYLGNIKWTSTSVIQILRNERHCGDVYTRKTFTPDFRNHLSRKNRGERPISKYFDHHDAIVSRDDFIAVQQMIDNAKYRNKSILPSLSVIEEGILKGFVTVNPRWAGFKEAEYYKASQSVYPKITEDELKQTQPPQEYMVKVDAGDFDLRGFEITRSEFFDTRKSPSVRFENNKIVFNAECIKKFSDKNFVELLINPISQKFAVRPTNPDNRSGVYISKKYNKKYIPKQISATAFAETVYRIFGWNTDYKYKIIGSLYEQTGQMVYIFDAANSEVLISKDEIKSQDGFNENNLISGSPVTPLGKRIRAIPEEWITSFGENFYFHELPLSELYNLSEKDWHLRLNGRLFESGYKLNVTPFGELRDYIKSELGDVFIQEEGK